MFRTETNPLIEINQETVIFNTIFKLQIRARIDLNIENISESN